MEYITLNNGIAIPKLGLGTFGMNEEKLPEAVKKASDVGIRLFDTSPNYKNDKLLGLALKEVNVAREELLIVEKVDSNQQLGSIRQALENCLKRLDLSYLDMYLIHWPFPDRYIKTWKQMEKLHEEGLIKTIGVCNFRPHHLEPLLAKANIVPAINQMEMHPLFTQMDSVEICRKNNIAIMSYTPLARMDKKLIENELLQSLAQKYDKTVPQIILRWNTQLDYVVIPKTENPKRIVENTSIWDFKLTEEELKQISALNQDYRVRFDPDDLSRYPKPAPNIVKRAFSKTKRIARKMIRGK